MRTGGDPNVSDALTINGHPGFLYPCSKSGFIINNLIPSCNEYFLKVFFLVFD